MIRYFCKQCNMETKFSECPVCGERTELEGTSVYWCKSCKIPTYDEICPICGQKGKHLTTDVRPVYPAERLLLEIIKGEPMKYREASVWKGSNSYYADGKRIDFSVSDTKEIEPNYIREKLAEYQEENRVNSFDVYAKRFVEANSARYDYITSEACGYIRKAAEGYGKTDMFVSFSGGKDSTVVSDLVMRALSDQQILHIYGDTTLEYPETLQYVKRFRKEHPKTPFLISRNNDKDFYDLCEKTSGPPSRVMRWCCTIFKTGAITKKIETTFKNKTRILAFQGIRRNESKARNKYDRDSNDSKIEKQLVVSPIIDWLDFDVWLYILSNNLDFNYAYKQGFNRVGCWCCPNNGNWSGFLSNIYMHNEYKKFYDILYSFAKKVGKSDWKDYIDEGKWKARQGGNGLEISENVVVSFAPCALEENAYNFTLSRPINTQLYTLFKPFGTLDFHLGNSRLGEVYVLDRENNQPILKLSGRQGKYELKVSVLKKTSVFKNKTISETLIKDQITKFQTCIGCSACQSVCRFDALKVLNLEKGRVSTETISYTIDEKKCVGCLECVKHFENGCYMRKVLRTKKGR